MAAHQLQPRVAEEGEVLGEGAAVGARGRDHCTPRAPRLQVVVSRRGRGHCAPRAPRLQVVDSSRRRGPGAGLHTPAVGGGLAHGQVAGPGPRAVVGVVHAVGALRGEHLSGGGKRGQGRAINLAFTGRRGPWCRQEGWAVFVIVIHYDDIIIVIRIRANISCQG